MPVSMRLLSTAFVAASAWMTLTGAALVPAEFHALHIFRPDTQGGDPQVLIQASDGNLYGCTHGGGEVGGGTLFRLSHDRPRKFEVLHQFATTVRDGRNPVGALVEDADGNLYGTTETGGGDSGDGTVFRATRDGQVTVLHAFSGGADGALPFAGPVLAADGYLYGTTWEGGSDANDGTVWRVATDGSGYEVLHRFQGDDGSGPMAELVQGRDGRLYGTAAQGGTSASGVAFVITTDGDFSLLHSFAFDDGTNPEAPLLQVDDGDFIGTAIGGGPNSGGTVFRLRPDGTTTVVHAFPGSHQDGFNPLSGLTAPGDGYLYGTTLLGSGGEKCPSHQCGVVYRIAPNGKEEVVHPFGSRGYRGTPHTGLTRVDHRGLVGTTQGYEEIGGTIYGIAPEPPAMSN
jgi:uncharacterized repeat protein (TIGR03803 family)